MEEVDDPPDPTTIIMYVFYTHPKTSIDDVDNMQKVGTAMGMHNCFCDDHIELKGSFFHTLRYHNPQEQLRHMDNIIQEQFWNKCI